MFCGDALFPLGCGRIFEGTTTQSYNAIRKIASLPSETKIYSGHEYAISNLEFAESVDPGNHYLVSRGKKLRDLRKQGCPTVPSTVEEEIRTNPFITLPTEFLNRDFISQNANDNVAIFSELRRMKDNF